MEWLDELTKYYDEYVAPAVKGVGDFVGGAVDSASSWLQGAADTAGSWAQEPVGMAPEGGSTGTRASFTPDVQAPINTSVVPQGVSQGVSSFVGNFGNSGSAGDADLGESEARKWMERSAPSVVSQSTPGAMGGDYAGAQYRDAPSLMSKAKAGMEGLATAAKPYQGLIRTGLQLGATLDKRGQAGRNQGYLDSAAEEEGRVNARNDQITTDRNAAEMAYSRSAPQNAYSNVINAGGRAARRAGMDTTQSASQRAAEQRRIAVNASQGGVTAAAGATRQPNLQAYTAPSSTARRQAALYRDSDATGRWQDYGALAQQALGWDDEAKKQVSGGRA